MATSRRVGTARIDRSGLAFAFAEVLAVGFVPAFSKFAMMRVDPLLYSAVAVTIAAVVSLALVAGRGEIGQLFRPWLLPRLVPIALLGTTATTLLILFGARLTDGVSTALLLQSEPIYSALLTSLLWKRAVARRQLFGTALLIVAIVLVVYDGTLHVGLGGLLVLLAPLGWQISHILALEVMPPMSPYALTAARYLYGGAALWLAQAVFGKASVATLGASGLAMCSFHGVVLFFCGTLFWYETIRRIDLARATAIVTPCEPVMSVALVWILLGAVPNAWQAAGLLLLLPGMWLVVTTAKAAMDPSPVRTEES